MPKKQACKAVESARKRLGRKLKNEQKVFFRARRFHQGHTLVLENTGWDKIEQIRKKVTFTTGKVIVRGKLVTYRKTRQVKNGMLV